MPQVTGSTAGTGFAIASALASESAEVIVNGRTPERVNTAIKKSLSKLEPSLVAALPRT